MFYSFVIICIFAQQCPTLLQDELGPYASVEECYLRGASIIQASSNKFPLVSAVSKCTTEDPDKIEKELKKKKFEKKQEFKGEQIKWNRLH
jgi:hypothetical protein